MQKLTRFIIAVFMGWSVGGDLLADEKPVRLVPVLKINTDLDKRTVIKPSQIPGAGNGLFVAVAIKKDEVIGELGGQLRTAEDSPADQYYMAS